MIALAGALGFYVWLKIATFFDGSSLSQPVLNHQASESNPQLSQKKKEEWVIDTLKKMREDSADDGESQEEKEEWVIDTLKKMRENGIKEIE